MIPYDTDYLDTCATPDCNHQVPPGKTYCRQCLEDHAADFADYKHDLMKEEKYFEQD